MISRLTLALVIGAIWAVASLAVLLPVLGLAWVATHLTDLTLAEAALLAFLHSATLVYLLQTYFAVSGPSLWFITLLFCVISLAIAMLEGLLVQKLTDLTFFQATLIASGASQSIAYMLAHSATGDIPSFLRGTILQDMMDDEEVDYIDQPPPRKRPPRNRKR